MNDYRSKLAELKVTPGLRFEHYEEAHDIGPTSAPWYSFHAQLEGGVNMSREQHKEMILRANALEAAVEENDRLRRWLKWALPFAERRIADLAAKPSSHQAFIDDDYDDLSKARAALEDV